MLAVSAEHPTSGVVGSLPAFRRPIFSSDERCKILNAAWELKQSHCEAPGGGERKPWSPSQRVRAAASRALRQHRSA